MTGLHTKTGLLKALNLVKKDGHRPVPVQNFYKGISFHRNVIRVQYIPFTLASDLLSSKRISLIEQSASDITKLSA